MFISCSGLNLCKEIKPRRQAKLPTREHVPSEFNFQTVIMGFLANQYLDPMEHAVVVMRVVTQQLDVLWGYTCSDGSFRLYDAHMFATGNEITFETLCVSKGCAQLARRAR